MCNCYNEVRGSLAIESTRLRVCGVLCVVCVELYKEWCVLEQKNACCCELIFCFRVAIFSFSLSPILEFKLGRESNKLNV